MAENTHEQQAENHSKAVNRFIELANAMKDEGLQPGEVSHALMAASGVYATYAIAGNDAGLNEAGVEKLAEVYKNCLADVQRARKEQRSPQ